MKQIVETGLVCLAAAVMTSSLCDAGPWQGHAILGNGDLTVVYSDDPRVSAFSHQGIQHFYFKNYTADYVAATTFEVVGQKGAALEAAGAAVVGMENFFTTKTDTRLSDGSVKTVRCFVHPDGAVVLSVRVSGDDSKRYRFVIALRSEIKTDESIRLISSHTDQGVGVAVWSNGMALGVAARSAGGAIKAGYGDFEISGDLKDGAAEVLLVPGSSAGEATDKEKALLGSGRKLEAEASEHWGDWMKRGMVPKLDAPYLEAYKRNLYCLKAANLRGQIPADITGQFVTNNMPQLYPRDAMMCTRVLLLTGHLEEAKQVIEFWARAEVPEKSPGEWYARYDAHGKAVDSGSGARFDEPEWDANGYYIYLLSLYHTKTGVWLVKPEFVYKLADFLVNHLSPDGLLWEGGIVEWTGYLPATHMIDAAALETAAKMAREFGDADRARRYQASAQKIAAALPQMFDETRRTYADVRFTSEKKANGASAAEQSGTKTFLWDTTANVGVIWGYPNHREIELSNAFYQKNNVRLGGGMQYFDSPDPGLAGYGHGVFFFTTAAAAEYQSLHGDKAASQGFIDWMMKNSNSYGLMPEHISPDGSEVSPASPLSWCCAEFAAALLLWSQR